MNLSEALNELHYLKQSTTTPKGAEIINALWNAAFAYHEMHRELEGYTQLSNRIGGNEEMVLYLCQKIRLLENHLNLQLEMSYSPKSTTADPLEQ